MSQYKSPSFLHTLRQSPFRASYGPSKSYGGVVATSKQKNKKSKSK